MKISTTQRLETILNKDIKSILVTNFQGIKTMPEAQQRLTEISQGELNVSPITILKMVFEAKVDLATFPFAQPESKEPKHRGKPEFVFDYSQLEKFKSCDKQAAADSLRLKLPKFLYILTKGVKKGKIKQEDYPQWFKTKKVKEPRKSKAKEKPVDTNLEGQRIAVQVHCECGNKKAWYTRLSNCGSELNLGLKGRKCPNCQKYGSYTATVKDNETLIRKAVVAHNDVLIEEFVNEEGKIVKNPLPLDFVDRYNQPEIVVEQ